MWREPGSRQGIANINADGVFAKMSQSNVSISLSDSNSDLHLQVIHSIHSTLTAPCLAATNGVTMTPLPLPALLL
jgi:hypothetical protein